MVTSEATDVRCHNTAHCSLIVIFKPPLTQLASTAPLENHLLSSFFVNWNLHDHLIAIFRNFIEPCNGFASGAAEPYVTPHNYTARSPQLFFLVSRAKIAVWSFSLGCKKYQKKFHHGQHQHDKQPHNFFHSGQQGHCYYLIIVSLRKFLIFWCTS